jgi:cell division protein FtsB
MKLSKAISTLRVFLILFVATFCSGLANAQSATPQKDSTNSDATAPPQLLQSLDKLVEQNRQLEKQNRDLMDQIDSLRQVLAKQAAPAPEKQEKKREETAPGVSEPGVSDEVTESQQGEGPTVASIIDAAPQRKWGAYTPNQGFTLASTDHGDINLSIYTYVRYLNQLGLDPAYTDAFGNIKKIQQRQDFQIQKLQMKFLGWVMSPKFRYFLYAWTSNASQGLGAQVVLAGNLNYTFNKHFNLAGGITSLPGTRSVEGNFPFWLGVDTRLIADEFFRPSYTSGIWARGEIVDRLKYQIMLGNNLSTLGVSAAQLDNGLNTVASALIWTPTSGEFGAGFGDFEHHEELAVRLAAHFTRSNETKQSQPNSDQFENTQLRLEDGSVIFTPNLFGQGIAITDATYKMTAFDVGLKFKGYSLDGEYFLRWLDHFHGDGTAGLPAIFSHGFQLQTSSMVLPKIFQVYLGGSTLYGKYGNPWDFRAGMNLFPFKNKVVRWNTEILYLHKSPVGYTSVPFALGGTGPVFHSNMELAF